MPKRDARKGKIEREKRERGEENDIGYRGRRREVQRRHTRYD